MTCRNEFCSVEIDAIATFCTMHRPEAVPAIPSVPDEIDEGTCDGCDESIPLDELDGDDRCEDCALIRCEDCNESIPEGEECTVRGDTVCEDCERDRTHSDCERCGRSTHEDNLSDGRCEDCNDEEDEGIERKWSAEDLPKFQSIHGGEIITSPRVFSAEIECYYPSYRALERAAGGIPREFGVEHDGSLNSGGIEFQTPKLKGKHGEDAIKQLCEMLNGERFRVNTSAGLHIHLDGAGLVPASRRAEPKAMKDALCFYMAMEEVLMSFLPNSRRNNRYCLALNGAYTRTAIASVKTMAGLESVWYKSRNRDRINNRKATKYDGSRYYGINFHSLLKDGHVEVRFHSGTLNATKILEWTNLHQRVLDMASDNALCERATEIEIGTNLREKTTRMYDLLGLTDRSRAYFDARQATFNPELPEPTETGETAPVVHSEPTEADSLDEVCAA